MFTRQELAVANSNILSSLCRKLGTLKRQKNELRPLGHALVSSFSVHQLSGGFGGEAAELCDDLLDRTVHCARQLDPKWFRGTKVVK